MWTRAIAAIVAAAAAGVPALAQTRPSARAITGSWEAYPLRGEGFGSGVQPKVRVPAPAPIPEPPLRQPHLDEWRALQAKNAELTRKGLPPPSTGMACIPEGMPGMMQATFPMEILETPGQITVIEEAFNQVRRIFLGAPAISPEDAEPRFAGQSTGRWEGAVLVVETAIGGWRFTNELCDAVNRRGLEYAPDFLAIDGGEGGSGAAPQALMDHMALPIAEALPRVVDALIESGLRSRIRVIAAGRLVNPAKAAWALCVGADFVNSARGFMFALGCIQALRCHQNTCPTGVTTHNKRLQRGLVVEEKSERVANYAIGMNKEIDMIAHSCGCRHARELRREHVRIMQSSLQSVSFNILHPYPEASVKIRSA
jgi:hypothetical protein